MSSAGKTLRKIYNGYSGASLLAYFNEKGRTSRPYRAVLTVFAFSAGVLAGSSLMLQGRWTGAAALAGAIAIGGIGNNAAALIDAGLSKASRFLFDDPPEPPKPG